jgi:N,N'-diacetyllegionaminate synthase
MRIGTKNTDDAAYIIAEIGNNHEGNFEVAKEMLIAASKTGIDAVKFQTYKTELFINPENPTRFNQLKSYQLSFNQFSQLAAIAKDSGVDFLSTPFDLESAQFLNDLVPAFKISSSDNNFNPLIKKIISFNKPVIMSCGIADVTTIDKTIDLIKNENSEEYFENHVALLHCVASYPTSIEEANLNSISFLRSTYNCTVGYSDHTLGIDAAHLSVALGGQVIEKHFTLDHNYSSFRDHQISANPQEMTELVNKVRNAEKMLGSKELKVGKFEVNNIDALRRSISANKILEAGHVISQDDFCWTRPYKGEFNIGNEDLLNLFCRK